MKRTIIVSTSTEPIRSWCKANLAAPYRLRSQVVRFTLNQSNMSDIDYTVEITTSSIEDATLFALKWSGFEKCLTD